MNKLIVFVFTLFMFMIPVTAFTQSSYLPLPPPGYHYERICYTSLIPFPHSQCDYRLVRHYRAVVPYHYHHYRPVPPPPVGPRPGHHPPPQSPNRHEHRR